MQTSSSVLLVLLTQAHFPLSDWSKPAFHPRLCLCTYKVLISMVPKSQGLPGHCICLYYFFFSAILLEFINSRVVCKTHEVNLPSPVAKGSAVILHPILGTGHQE